MSSQLASLRACGKYQKGMQGSGTLIHNIIYLQFERKEKKEKKRKEQAALDSQKGESNKCCREKSCFSKEIDHQ